MVVDDDVDFHLDGDDDDDNYDDDDDDDDDDSSQVTSLLLDMNNDINNQLLRYERLNLNGQVSMVVDLIIGNQRGGGRGGGFHQRLYILVNCIPLYQV